MEIIGITGSSGAGKTTICDILNKKYNAYIIDADECAKKLSKKGNEYLNSIIECFGADIINKDGELDRVKLANIVYNNDKEREKLNSITFVYVVNEIKDIIYKVSNRKLIVIDAPLLFESGLNKICNKIIGVIADKNNKIQRICKRDNINLEIAKKRISIQVNDEYLLKNANYIIYNDGNIENLEKQIQKIVNK